MPSTPKAQLPKKAGKEAAADKGKYRAKPKSAAKALYPKHK